MSKKTVVTKQEFIDGEPDETVEEGDETQFSPLFDDIDRQSKHIDKVYVRRTEPESGFLGTMPADVHEGTIFNKWGGGEYRLEAKNNGGRIVKVRTCKIAGDPVFLSEAEERRWRKQNGLPDIGKVAANTPTMQDVLMLLAEREEKARQELFEREERQRTEMQTREARERQLNQDRELQLQRDRDTREDRIRKDNEEREDRRRREAKEDEERRNTAHRQDMERLASMNATQLQQTQTFFTQLTAALKSDGPKHDPVASMLSGMQIAREMSGGGAGEPGDALTTLLTRLPETLSELRQTGAAAYSELSGRKAGRPAGIGKEEDFLTITGPTATRAKAVLAKLAAQGKNPEAVINQLLTIASGQRPGAPVANGQRPGAPPSKLAPPAGAKKGPPHGKRKPAPVATAPSPRSGRRAAMPRGAARRSAEPRQPKAAARAGRPSVPEGVVAHDGAARASDQPASPV